MIAKAWQKGLSPPGPLNVVSVQGRSARFGMRLEKGESSTPVVTRAAMPGPQAQVPAAPSGRMQLKRMGCVHMDLNITSETSSVVKKGAS